MFYGSTENEHFVGPKPLGEISAQICNSIGPSGTNAEYLFKLADSMREICPEALDEHLITLEKAVKELQLTKNNPNTNGFISNQ